MLRSYFISLWAWLRQLSRNPLAAPFLLAAGAGAAAAIQMIRWDVLPDIVLASIVAPIFIALMSLIPRIGGALSLGGSIGAGVGIATMIVFA